MLFGLNDAICHDDATTFDKTSRDGSEVLNAPFLIPALRIKRKKFHHLCDDYGL